MKVSELYDLLLKRYSKAHPETANLSIQEHFKWLLNRPDVLGAKLDPLSVGRKSAAKLKEFRCQGNEACKIADYRSALTLYTKAVLHAPLPQALSSAYGSRSAALYQSRRYFECLQDIELAFQHGYPPDKSFKLYERKVACFEALGDHKQAASAYREAMEKCQSGYSVSDIERKLASLELRSNKVSGNVTAIEANPWKPVPTIPNGRSSESATISSAVELQVSEARGRHYIATRDIDPGEVILVEKPYVQCLAPERYLSHCRNCFRRCLITTSCRSCSVVGYCSDACEREAWDSFHKQECDIIPFISALHEYLVNTLKTDKITGEIILPLAVILGAGVETVHQKFRAEQGKVDVAQRMSTSFASDSFDSLCNLLWSKTGANRTAAMHSAVIALKILQTTSFFGEFASNASTPSDPKYATEVDANMSAEGSMDEIKAKRSLRASSDGQQLSEFEVYVGVTLHLQRLISKLNSMQIDESELEFGSISRHRVGVGTFIQASLLNHSCHPNVARCFHSTSGVFRAVRCIEKGEEVVISYHNRYYEGSLNSRQIQLKKGYGFTCSCQACAGKWPMEKSDAKILCPNCNTPQALNVTRCVKCKKMQPGESAVSALQSKPERVGLFADIVQFNRTGVYTDALFNASVTYLKNLERSFAPPNDEIVNAIYGLQSCFQVDGNSYRRS